MNPEPVDHSVQRQLYGVAIFEEEIVVEDFTGGAPARFVVTPDQLMSFFRSGVVFRTFPGLVWLRDDGDARQYLLTLPAGERTILYARKKKILDLKLRLPSLAVRCSVVNDPGGLRAVELWAFSGATLKPESVLYEVPLPNINGASMCLGLGRNIGADVRAGVEAALFDGVFNHHNDIVGRERLSFYDYHRRHQGAVPLRSLKRIGVGRQILAGGK